MSEGIHSSLDVVSALISFFTVREAIKPADKEHPFGHGKIETLSSLFESLLLVLAAVFIIYEAVDHLRQPRLIGYQWLAIGTIFISMVLSYWVYQNNRKVAFETGSSAIEVNALHFLADVIACAGILLGLVLLRLTGWVIIDPLMAFGVAAYILVISTKQVRTALKELSDTQLPENETDQIREVLKEFSGKAIETHDLRTRKSGVLRHIDFHMVVCGHITVNASHALCDEIESRLQKLFPILSVNIHVEPCETHVPSCEYICDIPPQKKKFRQS